jgi:hypothetical protein
MRLTKADIRARAATRTKDIEVPQWAAENEETPTVTIKAWGIRDADNIRKQIGEVLEGNFDKAADLAPQIAAVSIVDEDGNLMFGAEDGSGVEELCGFAAEGLVRVMNEALRFNKLGYLANDAEGEAERLELIAKAKTEQAPEEESEESPN